MSTSESIESISEAELARRCAEAMWEKDYAAQELGITLQEAAPRRAVLSMRVQRHMLNGHAICHGGYIFTLADTAFAYACNSMNQVTVASGGGINFLAPAQLDDVLTATAEELSRSGRTGVYDVRVCDQRDKLIALFRGNSYGLSKSLVTGVTVSED